MAVDHIKEGLAPVVASYLRKYGFSSTLSAFLKENTTLAKGEGEMDLEALYKAYASTLEIGTTRAKKKRKNTQEESMKGDNDVIDPVNVEEVHMEQTNKALKKSKKMKLAEVDDSQGEQKKLVENKGIEEAASGPSKVTRKSKKLQDIVNGMQNTSDASKGEEQGLDQKVRKMGKKKSSKKDTIDGMEEAFKDSENDPRWKSMKEMENELKAANRGGELTRKSKQKSKNDDKDKKMDGKVNDSENERSDCILKPRKKETFTSEIADISSKMDNPENAGVEQKEGSKNKSQKNKSKKLKANEDVLVDSEKANRLGSESERKPVSEQNIGKECDDVVQVKESSCDVTRNAKKRGADNNNVIQEALQAEKKKSTKAMKETDTVVDIEHEAKVQNGAQKKKNQPSGALAFKRVVADKVEFADPRLTDNSYWAKDGAEEGYGAKAQEILGQVRGRGFRHEKTKKKRGSYRGGLIGLESHSIKFQNSDDDD